MTHLRVSPTIALLALLGMGSTAGAQGEDASLALRYDTPAKDWNQALPVGNGRLGAMVFGGAAEERLQINEDTVWAGEPHDYAHKGAVKYLPEIRRLLFEGKQREAEALAGKQFMSVPLFQLPYQPFVDIKLRFEGHDRVEDYQRKLDLDQAIASVRYKLEGVTYRREVFCSFPDQALVVRLEADQPGKLTFQASLSSPHRVSNVEAQGESLVLRGHVAPRREGRAPLEQPGAIRFEARVQAIPDGGQVRVGSEGIVVREASSVTLVLAGATNFKTYKDVTADPSARSQQALAVAAGKSIDSLKAAHIADHQRLFRRGARPGDERAGPANHGSTSEVRRQAGRPGTGHPLLPVRPLLDDRQQPTREPAREPAGHLERVAESPLG